MKARISTALALVAVLALGAVALTGCGGSGTTTARRGHLRCRVGRWQLTVSGSDTMVNLAQAWAEAYGEVNPNVMVSVKGGGSGNGIAALINKTTTSPTRLATSSPRRRSRPPQLASIRSRPWSPRTASSSSSTPATPSPTSPRTTWARSTAARSRTGRTLGGADAAIVLLGRDSSSGTYAFIQEEVVGKDKLYAKSMRNLQSTQAIVDEVAKNPNAIGYVVSAMRARPSSRSTSTARRRRSTQFSTAPTRCLAR